MTTFDGSKFRGLDDDALGGDGIIGDAPLDVFLEQSIASNSRYLAAGYDAVSIPLYGESSSTTPAATDRVWCSRNKSRIMRWPIILTRGLESITLGLAYAQSAEAAGGTNVNCELRLTRNNSIIVGGGQRLGTTGFALTASTDVIDTEQTVELNGPYSGAPNQIAYLELWIQCDAASDTGSNFTATNTADSFIQVSADITTPNDLRTQHLVSDTSGIEYDIRAINGDRFLYVYPDPSNEPDDTVFSIWEQRYLLVRGCSIRVNYNGDLRAGAPTVEELPAQRSIYATTTLPQLAAANNTYRNVRHVGFGPAGEAADTETAANSWHLWPLEPVNEIQMDGLIRNDVSGADEFFVVVDWITGFASGEITVRCTVSVEVLDDGDAGWSSATLVASGETTSTFGFVDFANNNEAQYAYLRENEAAARKLIREAHMWPGDASNVKTFVIRVPTLANLDTTRHSKPARLRIALTTTETDLSTTFNKYVTGYCVAASGTTEIS